jgi:hypothetical protein
MPEGLSPKRGTLRNAEYQEKRLFDAATIARITCKMA